MYYNRTNAGYKGSQYQILITMKIAFAGNFQYNCGSSNAILGYHLAGKKLEIDVRVSEFGYVDEVIRKSITVAGRDWVPDLFVIVYESYPFLSNEDLDQIQKFIPRRNRIIIDPDGKYLPPIRTSKDANHDTDNSYQYWTEVYDSLSDVILQPTLENVNNKKIHPFLYFGISDIVRGRKEKHKDFDLLYVGNNWYRWHDILWIIKAISNIRNRVKRIGLIGQFWLDDVMEGYENATYSDPEVLKENNIKILNPAPYREVENTMSRGLMHPILIRPILHEIGFVTPRMFETFSADTVPLIPLYFKHAEKLYGPEAKDLFLGENASEKIVDIMDNYNLYKAICERIRLDLIAEHSYDKRLSQLIQFM